MDNTLKIETRGMRVLSWCFRILLALILVGPVGQFAWAESITSDKAYKWSDLVKKGETPVGSLIEAWVNDDKMVIEKHNPLPSLEEYIYNSSEAMDITDWIEGKETLLKVYVSKQDPDELLLIAYWNDQVACYYHYNQKTKEYWGGRGTYQPDGNFEQVQNTDMPRFMYSKEAFFPELKTATEK